MKAYKQIMTIRYKMIDANDFDKTVNEALAEGWHLANRYTLPARTERQETMLVAELQRFVQCTTN